MFFKVDPKKRSHSSCWYCVTSNILAVGKSLLLLPIHDLKNTEKPTHLDFMRCLTETLDWDVRCRKHRGGIDSPTKWASYHPALKKKRKQTKQIGVRTLAEMWSSHCIRPVTPTYCIGVKGPRLKGDAGEAEPGWRCSGREEGGLTTRVTLLLLLPDYQGDVNDFYKSRWRNACCAPAYCHSKESPTNCLLRKAKSCISINSKLQEISTPNYRGKVKIKPPGRNSMRPQCFLGKTINQVRFL